MIKHLRELYRYRELIYMLVWRDIKVRYKQSVMGLLWAILMPMFIVLAGVMVKYAYSIVTRSPLSLEDLLVISAKAVPWAFLISSVRFACHSLISSPSLVTKVYFPKEIFPMAAVASQLIDFAVASVVVAVIFVVTGARVSTHLLWAPVLLGIMVLLAVGIGLLVSAGSLFYRDVKYIVEMFLTLGIFFTPVFYDAAMFGAKRRFVLLNPAAPILEGFASIVRHQQPDFAWLSYSLAFGVMTTLLAYIAFKKAEPSFAEFI
jgi:lipopolysaccharide transport system permease protein